MIPGIRCGPHIDHRRHAQRRAVPCSRASTSCDLDEFANKALSAMRKQFGGHDENPAP
jgi:6-phosphogluconate dehydrogenase (decarboxylating)